MSADMVPVGMAVGKVAVAEEMMVDDDKIEDMMR